MKDSQITMNDRNYDFFEDYYKRSSEKEKLELSLRFIVEKLNEKSMSAIVGAGFSLNSNSSFPDWANLLVDAYIEINLDKIRQEDNEPVEAYRKRIADAIRKQGEPVVAAEYERYKGKRESLDLYIENHILPIQQMPQELSVHEDFLNLNWCDIITTNWDNLLEQADKKNRYEVICSAKELKYSNRDRIVKIHGSLRTENEIKKQEYEFDDCYDHLYLITEKDYENYPKNHEGFSNFMKVKILENSFCLFGFSGNDWNFRYWVKELKRIMTKGGNTSNLNPIFLFDVSSKPYDSDQKLFFKNNYIIPLKLDDVFKIKGGSDNPSSPKNTSEKFSFIFNCFLTEKKKNDIVEFGRKNADNKILRKIAGAEKGFLTKDMMLEYINSPKFEISNLYYTQIIANHIQFLGDGEILWSETEYLFVYTWCSNNFFSLIQLFRAEKIEKIIKHFIEEKIYLTDAAPFSELIFGFCYDSGKVDDVEKYASLLNNSCEDIVLSQKCKYYFKQLNYEKINEILNNWNPENRTKANPLYILCKITYLLAIEPIYENKVDVAYLFEIALRNCNEESQLTVFILLYYRYYISNHNLKIDSNLMQLIDGLGVFDSAYPERFIDLLIRGDDDETSVVPNFKKRYLLTSSFPVDNYNEIKYCSFLNFFEYLNLPMEGIISEKKFVKLIVECENENLFRLFPYSFCYFGRSSDEQSVQTIIPLFLRKFPKETTLFLFEKYLVFFENKIKNNGNPKMLCFLLNELAKRIEKKFAKKYFDLFYALFSRKRNNSLQRLAINGRAWGIREPFVDYLRQIDDERQFNYMINWTVDRCLETAKEDIALKYYQKYFHALLNNKNVECYLKKFYKEKSAISKLVENFESHYFLVLDAFTFIDDSLKNWCTEFLKKNMSLEINPIFLKKCFSEEAKERIISIIEKKDYRYISSAEWPAVGYLRCLNELGKLCADDLRRVSPSINKLAEIYSGSLFVNDYYKLMMKPYYELVCEIFESNDFELKSAVDESIKIFKPIYEKKANEIFAFDWVSTQDLQMFRDSFADSFSYSIVLNRQNELIPYIGLVLSRIFLDDDRGDVSKYEAVLELFISYCEYEEWFELIKKNPTIKFGIVRIMRKFRQNIPLCYDDLFIRDKMFKLADIAKKMGVEDDSLVYWKKESNAG
jgi:hypothetical protein